MPTKEAKIKRGQVVYIKVTGEPNLVRERVRSVGPKYVTTMQHGRYLRRTRTWDTGGSRPYSLMHTKLFLNKKEFEHYAEVMRAWRQFALDVYYRIPAASLISVELIDDVRAKLGMGPTRPKMERKVP